jgi:succinate-semialdehyde dehydrogenase / glutarate-semialdehyde dehydrogenase
MTTKTPVLDFVPAPVQALFHSVSPHFDVISPSAQTVIATPRDNNADDARRAIEQSVVAFESWKQTSAYERSKLLRAWFNLIIENVDTVARLTSLEMGKPITEAKGEVRYAAGFIEWYAEEAKRAYGEIVPPHDVNKRLFVTRQPVGPVYGITPWNFPSAMVTRKVAPALAAGCTFILKPAEQSPLTAIYLAYLWEQVGGPAGTFLVCPTSDARAFSQPFFEDERVRKLTFTGSTEVGKILYAQSADTMKRISLELGGHAPFLIFADADIAQAVKEVVASKFRNAGQTCVCANRIYVHESIQAEFSQELAAAVSALRVGDPLDDSTQIGPLVDAQGLEKVVAHVTDAVEKGAHIVVGGKPKEGLFYTPTVLVDVKPGMRVMEEETFGPVAPITPFTNDADAIRMANDTSFGLAAYLYTRDITRAMRTAEALEYGIVGLNDGLPSSPQVPFGGVKQSGIGREGGHWGLAEYLDVKYISLGLK